MSFHVQTIKTSRLISRSPVFYGWVVLVAATIGMWATAPGQSFSISLFIDQYIAEFGLDRTTVSGLFGLGSFLAALGLTWIGRLIDLHGNRRMSVIIGVLFALALLGSSVITGPITLLLSFIAIRGLGQGALGLVSTTAIAHWFHRRRGLMIALSMVTFALFQRLYIPGMQAFIEAHGWRTAWLLAGVVVAALVVPVLGALLRDRPEAFGLRPDGRRSNAAGSADSAHEANWTLGEAMRTPLFWTFTFARILSAAWGTALIFHQLSLFSLLGHSAEVAANTLASGATLTAVVTLLAGWFVDRLRPGLFIAIQMTSLIASTSLALFMREPLHLFLYTVAYALFMGGGQVFDSTVWVNVFGRQNQGAIRGFVATAQVIGTAIGPIIFGIAYDATGGYGPSVYLGVALALIAMALALIVPLPQRRAATSTGQEVAVATATGPQAR